MGNCGKNGVRRKEEGRRKSRYVLENNSADKAKRYAVKSFAQEETARPLELREKRCVRNCFGASKARRPDG